jgi:hypothetical protein
MRELLDYRKGALAIEVVDIKDAHHRPDNSRSDDGRSLLILQRSC